jgi:hypothetical protein
MKRPCDIKEGAGVVSGAGPMFLPSPALGCPGVTVLLWGVAGCGPRRPSGAQADQGGFGSCHPPACA